MGRVAREWGVALVRKEKSSIAERGETRSSLPPRSGGRCPRGTEGGARSHEVSTEPPSACGISPRCAGGEGSGAASSPAEWRERGAGAADLRIRSATPCGRPGREGSRSADPPIRSATPCGRPGREGSRSADPPIRSATPCGRPGREGEPVGRSPDSVGHSLWPTGARGEPVGRSPDSVGHSLWPTGGARELADG